VQVPSSSQTLFRKYFNRSLENVLYTSGSQTSSWTPRACRRCFILQGSSSISPSMRRQQKFTSGAEGATSSGRRPRTSSTPSGRSSCTWPLLRPECAPFHERASLYILRARPDLKGSDEHPRRRLGRQFSSKMVIPIVKLAPFFVKKLRSVRCKTRARTAPRFTGRFGNNW
jgi:hypothetical protein